MTRDEFFNKLEAGAKWDVGVAIARTNPLPLDANSVFKSLDDLTAYATSNPLAYPGQVVSVLGETEIAAYLIKTTGSGAAISKLAASSATGDISADVEALKTQVANIINGTQVVGAATKATQDGEGNVIKDTYVSNGSLATTLTQTLADYAKLDGAAFTGPVTVQAPTAEANPATKKYVDDAMHFLSRVLRGLFILFLMSMVLKIFMMSISGLEISTRKSVTPTSILQDMFRVLDLLRTLS